MFVPRPNNLNECVKYARNLIQSRDACSMPLIEARPGFNPSAPLDLVVNLREHWSLIQKCNAPTGNSGVLGTIDGALNAVPGVVDSTAAGSISQGVLEDGAIASDAGPKSGTPIQDAKANQSVDQRKVSADQADSPADAPKEEAVGVWVPGESSDPAPAREVEPMIEKIDDAGVVKEETRE
jgi:hypothetical protein